MRGSAVVVLLVAMILIGAGAGYLVGENNPQNRALTNTTTKTVTTGSSVTTIVTVTTFYPDMGSYLKLRIEMNTSSINSHGAVWVQITLSNPLNSNLTATVPESSNSTVSNWSWDDFLCGGGSLGSVVSFALFQGHYNAENISLAGEPLTLAPPLMPPCVAYPTPLFLIYQPSDSIAWAYTSNPEAPPLMEQTVLNATTEICSTSSSGATICGPGAGLFGYWNGPVSGPMGNYTTSSPDFHYFSPGAYTLAAEDAWGHQAFSYFEVS